MEDDSRRRSRLSSGNGGERGAEGGIAKERGCVGGVAARCGGDESGADGGEVVEGEGGDE